MGQRKYGNTWWGKEWLNSLSNIDYSSRLPRGRSYANKGAVKNITIHSTTITAKVAGSRPRPYQVQIEIPSYTETQKNRFVDALITRPSLIASLLDRQLAPGLLQLAKDNGLRVFPSTWTDFEMHCSCPDWATPCKHLAAVIYMVSLEIDNNPFLAFELHDFDLLAALEARQLPIARADIEVPLLHDIIVSEASTLLPTDRTDVDWSHTMISYADIPELEAILMQLLDEDAPFSPSKTSFKKAYSSELKRISKNAARITQGKTTLQLMARAENKTALDKRENYYCLIQEDNTVHIKYSDGNIAPLDFMLAIASYDRDAILDHMPNTQVLHTAYELTLHLISRGAIIPQIVRLAGDQYIIRWVPATISKVVNEKVQKLEKMIASDMVRYAASSTTHYIITGQANQLISSLLSTIIPILAKDYERNSLEAMFFCGEQQQFVELGTESVPGGIMSWLQKYNIARGDIRPTIQIKEYSDNLVFSVTIGIRRNHYEDIIPLVDIRTKDEHEEIRYAAYSQLNSIAAFVPSLSQHLESNNNNAIILDSEAFTPFLLEVLPVMQLLDIDIYLPKSLQTILKPKPSVRIATGSTSDVSYLKLADMFSFDWRIAIGDELLDENSFNALKLKSNQLLKYKSNYIYVSAGELAKIHKHMTDNKKLSGAQLLQTALTEEFEGAPVILTDEVKAMIKALTKLNNIPVPEELQATLRPYQKRGYSWLYRNSKIGFGSVLADDMGLGKTIQVITLLLNFKSAQLLAHKPAMIIAPTGLITNWQSELQKFAPSLSVHVFHGPNRSLDPADKDSYDVLITSYGLARSDKNKLKKREWSVIAIDEAQNIKNPKTAQTKAIKSLPADITIALSGTPVENNLNELHSIFDFCNPGYLGSLRDFQKKFGKPIQQDHDLNAADKLKAVTAPFMMRRLKTDKTIIKDLPDKIEMDVFAHLTKEQAALYQKTLEKALKDIDGIEDDESQALFKRQGLVLQMILALKQICNHPTQYLKNNVIDPDLSGKMSLLFERLDSIIENHEKVLIFTQFKEMGNLLEQFIAARYGEKPLFYHGGVNIKKRQKMVDDFQHNNVDKVFILSLKAAGTGLNLTRANHVIHYDLWWNPAVEAQATDRAFRIGQTKNVMVHRFITKNTFEERINDMINNKKHLANITVGSGEKWIGQLNNKELRELFTL